MIGVVVQDQHLTSSRLWYDTAVEVERHENVEEVTEVVVHVAGGIQLDHQGGSVDCLIALHPLFDFYQVSQFRTP